MNAFHSNVSIRDDPKCVQTEPPESVISARDVRSVPNLVDQSLRVVNRTAVAVGQPSLPHKARDLFTAMRIGRNNFLFFFEKYENNTFGTRRSGLCHGKEKRKSLHFAHYGCAGCAKSYTGPESFYRLSAYGGFQFSEFIIKNFIRIITHGVYV